MEVYRYTFDKGSKKFICPNCSKKTFVKFIDTGTGNYLPDDFGKCDREKNCRYFKAPPKATKYFLIKVLALKDISNKAIKATDVNGNISIVPKSQILEQSKDDCWISEWFLKNSTFHYLSNEFKYSYSTLSKFVNEVKQIVQPPPIETSYHSLELLDKMYNETQTDHLTEFLKMRFSVDEVLKAKQKYFITGTNLCWFNSTVFWQIDDKEQIHAGKIMQYDRFTGKRVKEPYNRINWLHKALTEPYFNLNQCLFGLHQIAEDFQRTIAIVESEKTAIVMSILLPHYIWLATGNKGNFKFEMLKPIKKRNIVSFPDKGEYLNWLNVSTELNAIGFKISVSEILEDTDFENGFDLADYYLNL